MTMKHETYNGVEIPKIGLGTSGLKDDLCTDIVRYAIDEAGYRHIDTAQGYKNERAVGAALKASAIARDALFVTTKIWLDNMAGDRVEASLAASLEKLQTDYCDLVLVHWPNVEVPFQETLAALKAAQDKGMTRLIGISNFTMAQVKEVRDDLGFDVAVNQCEYHPFLDQSPLIEQARSYGMAFTAYSPLVRGGIFDNATIQDIARKHGKSAAQVTLRWLYQQDGIVAIPRSSKKEHVKSNIDILDFALPDEDMRVIDGLRAQNRRVINPDFSPDWDVAA